MPASPSKQLNPMMVRMLGCLFWAAIGWTAAFFGIIREVGWLALFGASTMVVFCVLSFCFWVQLFLTRSRGSEPSSGNSDRTLQFPPGSPPSEASQTKLVQRRSLFLGSRTLPLWYKLRLPSRQSSFSEAWETFSANLGLNTWAWRRSCLLGAPAQSTH